MSMNIEQIVTILRAQHADAQKRQDNPGRYAVSNWDVVRSALLDTVDKVIHRLDQPAVVHMWEGSDYHYPSEDYPEVSLDELRDATVYRRQAQSLLEELELEPTYDDRTGIHWEVRS